MFDALFGNGKLEIRLAKLSFMPSEVIEGSIEFALDEPKEGRALVIGLRATQRIRMRTIREGTVRSEEQKRNVYEFKNELSGERTYSSGTKHFSLTVPPDALLRDVEAPDGFIGDIARVASFLQGESRSPVEWEVFSYIDLPWKVNVKKSQAITIVAGPPRVRIG